MIYCQAQFFVRSIEILGVYAGPTVVVAWVVGCGKCRHGETIHDALGGVALFVDSRNL